MLKLTETNSKSCDIIIRNLHRCFSHAGLVWIAVYCQGRLKNDTQRFERPWCLQTWSHYLQSDDGDCKSTRSSHTLTVQWLTSQLWHKDHSCHHFRILIMQKVESGADCLNMQPCTVFGYRLQRLFRSTAQAMPMSEGLNSQMDWYTPQISQMAYNWSRTEVLKD